MDNRDNDNNPATTSADDLLGELESIKDILEESDRDHEPGPDIPLLQDVITIDGSTEQASVLPQQSDYLPDPDNADSDSLNTAPNPDPVDILPDIPAFSLTTLAQVEPDITAEDLAGCDLDLADAELLLGSGKIDDYFDQLEPDGHQPPPQTDQQSLQQHSDPAAGQEKPALHAATPGAVEQDHQQPAETDYQLDLLVQEIVDEFIPVIEDQLRQRLTACSPEILQQLAAKHLNI